MIIKYPCEGGSYKDKLTNCYNTFPAAWYIFYFYILPQALSWTVIVTKTQEKT